LTEQQEIITTFSEMAPRYESLMNSELNRFWGIDYSNFVNRLLEDFSPKSQELILDIATGTSFIPSFLIDKKKVISKMIGLDITFGMLMEGKERLFKSGNNNMVPLVCASAHQMPFQHGTFDHAICCLATHHMDADELLTNIYLSLRAGGMLRIADAGASSKWKNKLIRSLIKIAAFLYFFISENFTRAMAESAAIGNVHTSREWEEKIKSHGFVGITIEQLKSKHFWAPNPLFIKAIKNLT
jgi:ubiquinone/menaquinone biosynthesis C-methylase UbiE